MLIRKLVVVGLVGFVSFAANIATAEDAVGPSSTSYAIDGVDLVDPAEAFPSRFQLSSSDRTTGRFTSLALTEAAPAEASNGRENSRGYEVRFTGPSVSGLNVSFAQRGGLGFNAQGDINRRSRSSELRLGRGLDLPRSGPSNEPSWYFFAASEDEALTWRPGASSELGGSSFTLQDRVEIGDMQAGVTYERYGIQTSLAYVRRKFTVVSGVQSFSHDDSFAGLTVTMRH